MSRRSPSHDELAGSFLGGSPDAAPPESLLAARSRPHSPPSAGASAAAMARVEPLSVSPAFSAAAAAAAAAEAQAEDEAAAAASAALLKEAARLRGAIRARQLEEAAPLAASPERFLGPTSSRR